MPIWAHTALLGMSLLAFVAFKGNWYMRMIAVLAILAQSIAIASMIMPV